MSAGKRGVTLIELLIAVTLLSLLAAGMLMALRIGLNSMEQADNRLMANRRSMATQQILRSQIEGFIPVNVLCSPVPDASAPLKIMYFEGQPQSMRFVSSYSLKEASRGIPRVLEFAVIPGDHDEGVRLIVNESLYTGPAGPRVSCLGMTPDPETNVPMPQYPPIEAGPNSFVLADKLEHCRFSYRRVMPPPVIEVWPPLWNLRELPSAVHIDMAPLKPQAARVPLVSATVPIHVNRKPGMIYAQ
ncbi:MAG TPA: prepilin-type N-terminal cleavage/methylation domain-containing protein [Bryobacteraceae bacterium]|nr:prepilin-type N-terminal cleavage/methylation domain-containing protein [Bryobacteraceae bacterium]